MIIVSRNKSRSARIKLQINYIQFTTKGGRKMQSGSYQGHEKGIAGEGRASWHYSGQAPKLSRTLACCRVLKKKMRALCIIARLEKVRKGTKAMAIKSMCLVCVRLIME